jgi:hypothetical protein
MVDLPTPPLELITATILAGTSLFVYMLACLHTSFFVGVRANLLASDPGVQHPLDESPTLLRPIPRYV